MRTKILFFTSIFLVLFSCKETIKETSTVSFPVIEGPVQLTGNSKEHLFASYYGINSFNRSEIGRAHV